MPPAPRKQQQDTEARVEHLQRAIATLEAQVQDLQSQGEVAPAGCSVSRYQVRQQQKAYWYYKLHAIEPTFPKATGKRKLSRYKHLGKAGSPAHVDAVISVVRRAQIDELQRAIHFLKQALVDVCYEGELEDLNS